VNDVSYGPEAFIGGVRGENDRFLGGALSKIRSLALPVNRDVTSELGYFDDEAAPAVDRQRAAAKGHAHSLSGLIWPISATMIGEVHGQVLRTWMAR